jgi:putative spermidine/putrescine transport system permease protein
MKTNGAPALIFHILFVTFILAPLVVICLVAFTDKG